MKWSTLKSSSLITRVFSKFKRNSSSKTTKLNSSTVLDFPSPNSSFYREGRFYSMDEDDAYWRISFGADDRIQPRRSTGGINPLWQDSDNDIENHMAEGPRRNFTEMVSDIKKMREKRDENGGGEKPRKKQEWRDDRKLRVKRTKAYSPRSECKIRAIEEMRKAKTKKKDFKSFAVVKSSLDPRRDFKDSMVEMIREKGIGHPDDLQELLACYLTLNCHEYHDLIITVFQQVWIELNNKCSSDPLTKNVPYFH